MNRSPQYEADIRAHKLMDRLMTAGLTLDEEMEARDAAEGLLGWPDGFDLLREVAAEEEMLRVVFGRARLRRKREKGGEDARARSPLSPPPRGASGGAGAARRKRRAGE